MSDFTAMTLLVFTIILGIVTLFFFNSNMNTFNTQLKGQSNSQAQTERVIKSEGSDSTTSNYKVH